MVLTRDRVPPHLRRYVVEQDYAAYDAVDQAVWRFVLLQMYDRLEHSAHPAYARGLSQTGMSVDRIPRIADMDRCLSDFGWGAVCVDGFIPPRAFQEFQSLGILPIAAEMRRVEHLPYTPAPDIIHEAAGHAPILPDPEYAAFLRRIGEYGTKAFASGRDAQLYAAVRRLSFVKEQRDAAPADIAEAERALAELVAVPAPASEATRLSRLYWWTVEYGLYGTPERYKLYGAGLLSSLAESHFCHDPAVRKLPLRADCVDVDYDITRPQPQLFTVPDFGELSAILEEVCAGFAFRQGGLQGLATAQAGGEPATIELDSGLQITGEVADVRKDAKDAWLVRLRGSCALGRDGRLLAEHGRSTYPRGLALVLADGAGSSRALAGADFAAGTVTLEGEGDLRIEARGARPLATGALPALVATSGRITRAGTQLLRDEPLVIAAGRVRSVRAGAEDAAFWPEAEYPQQKAPMRAPEQPRERERRALYERGATSRTVAEWAVVHERLQRDFPDDWLLRWNGLRSLTELGADAPRCARLADELLALEERYQQRNPIAMGLRYLGYGSEAERRARSA